MLYPFFRTIPWRLNIIRRRFGTLCSIFIGGTRRLHHLCRWNRVFRKSAYKIQTPGNHPKERIQVIYCSGNDTFLNICLFEAAESSIDSPRCVTSVRTPEYEIIISCQVWWLSLLGARWRGGYFKWWAYQLTRTPYKTCLSAELRVCVKTGICFIPKWLSDLRLRVLWIISHDGFHIYIP